MYFARIKTSNAISHMNLSRDSFSLWCEAVGLKSHKFEHSNRRYFVDGEFFAKADIKEIERLKKIHGEKWKNYYPHSEKVIPYLKNVKKEKVKRQSYGDYTPKSKSVSSFINKLKK